MKPSNLLIAALVILLSGAGATVAYLARENFDLKVEVGTLRYKLEAAAKTSPAPSSSAPAAAQAPDARAVSDLTRQVMLDILSAETGIEKKLWIRAEPGDGEAGTFARQISAVFRDAGWEVVVIEDPGARFKPGLLMLIGAENAPASYVQTARRALEALRDPLKVGTGYIDYYEKNKTSPNFRGFQFLPGQTYLLWVGRRPQPSPGE